ncbi:hypothetical protein F511_03710 [Dorcoceras hygrometricum]|uniref:Uncharacterized protein n=1 Tax=Dorcoceras hygrometricum TaxID=472368 RepID=A0A2Z7BDT3_9LAMI|nr:hypothetical protein F511_03710 [Dorcoceras hygrometricum]
MEDTSMVRMFKSLEESGQKGILGVSRSVFEGSLVEFFTNAKVIAGTIFSMVADQKLVITIDVFAVVFQLPTDGGQFFRASGQDSGRDEERSNLVGSEFKNGLPKPFWMSPRRRRRARRQIPIESEGQNEAMERMIPVRRHARQVDDEVEVLQPV